MRLGFKSKRYSRLWHALYVPVCVIGTFLALSLTQRRRADATVAVGRFKLQAQPHSTCDREGLCLCMAATVTQRGGAESSAPAGLPFWRLKTPVSLLTWTEALHQSPSSPWCVHARTTTSDHAVCNGLPCYAHMYPHVIGVICMLGEASARAHRLPVKVE